MASGSLMHEVDIDLRSHPKRLRLQFGVARPMKLLVSVYRAFEEGECSSSMSMEMPEDLPDVTHLESWEGAYLVSETLTLRTEPTCKMTSLLKVPVDVPDFMTLQDMHGLLARETGNPALKWELKNVSELVQPAWEELELGQLRRLMFRLPLNPKPAMATLGAPQHTRMVVVYYLADFQDNHDSVQLIQRSRPLDVPYGTAFYVNTKFIFTKVDGVMMGEAQLGLTWTGRCLIRGIVETASKDEAMEGAKEFFEHTKNCVRAGGMNRQAFFSCGDLEKASSQG